MPTTTDAHEDVVRSWIRASWVAAAGLAIVAIAYSFAATSNSEAYGDHWRGPYYAARIEGYRWFLPAMSAAAALWALVLSGHQRLERWPTASHQSLQRWLGALFGAVLLALAIYFSNREWIYFNQSCWDGYCEHARLFLEWFRGNPSAGTLLLDYARTDYHANSPVAPIATGFAAWATGVRVVVAYRALCALATLGTLAIVFRSLMPRLAIEPEARTPALVLLATHLIIVRSFLFPQTDPFVLLWTTALFALALDQIEVTKAWRTVVLVLLLVVGIFTKLSFLPALILIPGWRALSFFLKRRDEQPQTLGSLIHRLAIDGCCYVLVPAATFVGYQLWVGSFELYTLELERMTTVDTTVTYHLVCILQAGTIAGILIGLRDRPLGRREWLLAAWVALYGVSLWTAQTSGWARFYLPVLPALALLAAPGLARIGRVAGGNVVWAFVLISATLNYLALGLRLYY